MGVILLNRLAALLAVPTALALATPAVAQNASDCASAIASTEASRNIPRGLLMAIAVTESALNGRPNPFAMNIAGRGYHAASVQDMTSVINQNWSRGVRSIDVGCMQINLRYHGSRFPRLTDLLDTTTNVNYGASFLIQLATEAGSWRDAVMNYHNRTNPGRRAWYGCKVWNNYLRITGATSGHLACGRTPTGSSTAAVGSTAPIMIAGYNQNARTAPRPSPGPLTPPSDTHVGSGMIGETVIDVPIPQRRAQGTLTIVGAGSGDMPDIINDDERASAFNAVRPMNWAGRVQRTQREEPAAVHVSSEGGSGFGRVVRHSDRP